MRELLKFVTSYLGSRSNAFAIILALLLFLAAAHTGLINAVKYTLRNVELQPDYLIIVLLIVSYCVAIILITSLMQILEFGAKVSKSVLSLLSEWYHAIMTSYAARQHFNRNIAYIVAGLSLQEKAFLDLFNIDGVSLQRMTYELLPHPTYVAYWSLVKKGIICKIVTDCDTSIECFTIGKDIIPLLCKKLYKGKELGCNIVLRLDRVAAGGASGSGS